jgi:prenyltransferase beta subunit
VGLKAVGAALVAALTLAPTGGVGRSAAYLAARQNADGGFAEAGGRSDPALTAWVALALAAAGRPPTGAADYLADKPYPTANDLALRILALRALGERTDGLADRLEDLRRPDGRMGPLVNSTVWAVLALRAAGRPAGVETVRYLLRQQRSGGGWSWAPRGAPDSNDTAAAIQALRAAGVAGRPISRGLSYLRRLQGRDGGFALVPGRASDAQSTAWATQAFVAGGVKAPATAYRFLARLRRGDGSYRYSARYAVTPVWVTAQVVPAVARRSLPLRQSRFTYRSERGSGR